MNIKDFAERGFKAEEEAWYNGNFELLKEIEDPNMVVHMYGGLPDMIGHDGHKKDIISSRQTRSDVKLQFQFLTGEGNLYAASLKLSYRVTGQKPGFTIPIGKKVLTDELLVLRVKNGRIIEVWPHARTTITD
jgi:predicted ester cyclase